jgi:hypothetical protein
VEPVKTGRVLSDGAFSAPNRDFRQPVSGRIVRQNAGVNKQEVRRAVSETFVNDATTYGCAETSYIVLKDAYGLPNPHDSGPAMALNGGVAYQGGICGALSGAALAVGQLAAARIPDHATASCSSSSMTSGTATEASTAVS